MNTKSYVIAILLCILLALAYCGYTLWLHQQLCGAPCSPIIEIESSNSPDVEHIVGTWEGLSFRGLTYCLLNLTPSNTGWMVEYAGGISEPYTAESVTWAIQDKKIRITGTSESSKLCGDAMLDGPLTDSAMRPDKILIFTRYEPDVSVQYTLIPLDEMAEKRSAALAHGNEISNK